MALIGGMSVASLFYFKPQIQNFQARFFSNRVAMAEPGFNEVEISFAEELKEGEMRELVVGAGEEDKVLVARYDGKLRCLGNYCPHFNLPLAKSFMADDMIVCPFHNAAFSVLTGQPERAPAIDGLPVFEIIERDGKFYAKVPTVLPKKQTMPMVK